MVNTNRPKKIALSRGGMTNVPSCPRTTATIKVQAVAPMANPRTRTRPSTVPMAIARKRKISGALATTWFIPGHFGSVLVRSECFDCLQSSLRQDHCEISEHSEQDSRQRVCDGESDPRHRAADLHRSLAARTGVRTRAGDAAHQDSGVYLEKVVADRPHDEGRDRARDKANHEDLQCNRSSQLSEQTVAGVDTDDRDKHNETQVFQNIAGSIRSISKKAKPRDRRRNDHARQQQAACIAKADP